MNGDIRTCALSRMLSCSIPLKWFSAMAAEANGLTVTQNNNTGELVALKRTQSNYMNIMLKCDEYQLNANRHQPITAVTNFRT